MKPKAYSYIRFSSLEQRHGRSQARQTEACEEYCQQHGLELAKSEEYTFLDAGLSGYKGEHLGDKGQLKRFISLVDDGTIAAGSTLIVESLDRLSRQDVWSALTIFMDLIRKGIRIVTLTDNRVYSDDRGEQDLILSIFIMSRAHEESSTKARRVRDAMRKKHEEAREHKKPMGKAIPLWLELSEDKKSFVVREDRAAVVRRIFDMAINGYGKDVTAKTLNAERIPSFKGTTWGASSIDKMLGNKSVLGFYQPYSVQVGTDGKRQPAGEPIPHYYPAIIEETTYFQAQAAISARKLAQATKQSKNFNVWQGIAKCVHCGTAMHLVNKGRPPKGNTYIHCYSARKGLCKGKAVRLDHSEIVFKELLAKVDALALVQDSSGKISKELAQVDGRLAEQRKKLKQYSQALQVRFTATLEELAYSTEQEIAGLEKRKSELQAALGAEKIGNKRDFWEKLDLVSYEGRHRANALLKRLKVESHIGKGYFITEKRKGVFVLAYKDGAVGYMAVQDEGENWDYQGAEEGEGAMEALLSMMEKKIPFLSLTRHLRETISK